MCIDYAVLYYKNKSIDLGKLYTRETVHLLNQHTKLKAAIKEKDNMLNRSLEWLKISENIIYELRGFIVMYLYPMIDIVVQETDGVCQTYKEERGEFLPQDIEDDPFDIFQLYTSCV